MRDRCGDEEQFREPGLVGRPAAEISIDRSGDRRSVFAGERAEALKTIAAHRQRRPSLLRICRTLCS
jgi:hypothetical protein